MKSLHYKKSLLGLFTSILLMGCVNQLEVNDAIIVQTFNNLLIDVDTMIAHDRVDNVVDPHYDRTEMIDATDKQSIFIYTSLYDEIESRDEERLLCITAEYVYVYIDEEMSRIDNPYDINEETYYQEILTTYTLLFDLDFLSLETFKEIALNMQQTTLVKTRNQYSLKGLIEPPIPIGEEEIFENEFIYNETHLVQASQKHRHNYASTWQKSNFISGIDYFFGTSALPEFPPLSQFGY
jgi:hypothetical protein